MSTVSGIFTAAFGALALGAMAVSQPVEARPPQGPVPGKPGEANIVEIALAVNASSGEFSYLLAAATCEEFDGAVVTLLSGNKHLTLFAPTDTAFEALQIALGVADPAPEVTCTLPSATVLDILTYHVTEGRRFSNSVFNRNAVQMLEMLNGQFVITNPDLSLNDIAGQSIGLVAPLFNINASNGVIHVIDTVLLPF